MTAWAQVAESALLQCFISR